MARRVKQTWIDLPGGGTPTSAARFNNQEDGIFNVDYRAAVRVFHNANQSILNNTVTTLAFNSERFDTENNAASTIHDNVTNNSRLTCRTAGIYMVGGNIEWAASPVNSGITIRLNGTTDVFKDFDASDHRNHAAVTFVQLAVNDYLELRVQQISGGALNVNSTSQISPEFWMVLVA